MKKLSLLILCLLAICKSFSQTDTLQQKKTKYVFLTEEQARANIKDLLAYDGLKLISAKQEERIQNLQQQNFSYWRVINLKDSIIAEKDGIIDVQDKIINNRRFVKFHTYVGAETFNLDTRNFVFFGRAELVFIEKLSVGARMNFVTGNLYALPDFYYNITVEYKIF